jgi:hypothetical protein
MGGVGYDAQGNLRQDWSANWEGFLDKAESYGIYVLPFFTGWANWNDRWDDSPFNSANGGPADDPSEIYRKDSPTQTQYVIWFKRVVERWQGHKNILAWETVTEINLINGITQVDGVYLARRLAAAAREADTAQRPVTVSLGAGVEWPDLFRSDALDFFNHHPYPNQLDRDILTTVPRLVNTYHKPVLIGESGLSWASPISQEGLITTSTNARVGVQHAIWAETVSGSMNGRALWWEDSFGLYYPQMSWSFLESYTDVDAGPARFMAGVDMTGFKPVAATTTGQLLGASLGNDHLVIGWYRDSQCEPPDWNLRRILRSTVSVAVPNPKAGWQVTFYDTRTGAPMPDVTGSVAPTNKAVVITLPDLQDDIAFKLSRPGSP